VIDYEKPQDKKGRKADTPRFKNSSNRGRDLISQPKIKRTLSKDQPRLKGKKQARKKAEGKRPRREEQPAKVPVQNTTRSLQCLPIEKRASRGLLNHANVGSRREGWYGKKEEHKQLTWKTHFN